jgi:hypothetical protein
MGMGTGGMPTTDNIPETTEKLGFPTDNIPETTEKLGFPTDNIPDSRFFKTLNFIIFICNDERTNIYLKFYFKIMFLSHNNVVFITKSKSKILINSIKSRYNLAHYLTF